MDEFVKKTNGSRVLVLAIFRLDRYHPYIETYNMLPRKITKKSLTRYHGGILPKQTPKYTSIERHKTINGSTYFMSRCFRTTNGGRFSTGKHLFRKKRCTTVTNPAFLTILVYPSTKNHMCGIFNGTGQCLMYGNFQALFQGLIN